ncbi:hypothetical protein F511_23967 [Dorcoceras hygrometricum]|uniref:Uncharacterized protein n=1 Tax=Dorcoceras hygrometricum TaxID=472368 RepID=A0A2Z7AIK4_9LAMI|nr:hypothetical protein F511_23967 [Dorcoceras hygrometricum]
MSCVSRFPIGLSFSSDCNLPCGCRELLTLDQLAERSTRCILLLAMNCAEVVAKICIRPEPNPRRNQPSRHRRSGGSARHRAKRDVRPRATSRAHRAASAHQASTLDAPTSGASSGHLSAVAQHLAQPVAAAWSSSGRPLSRNAAATMRDLRATRRARSSLDDRAAAREAACMSRPACNEVRAAPYHASRRGSGRTKNRYRETINTIKQTQIYDIHRAFKIATLLATRPRPDTGFLRQPALEGLTRSARTDSPRQDWPETIFRRREAAAAEHGGGGGGGLWRGGRAATNIRLFQVLGGLSVASAVEAPRVGCGGALDSTSGCFGASSDQVPVDDPPTFIDAEGGLAAEDWLERLRWWCDASLAASHRKYIHELFCNTKEHEFDHLVQGDLKMTVCLRQFSSLPAYVPLVARRVRKKQNRFLKGLRDDPHPLRWWCDASLAASHRKYIHELFCNTKEHEFDHLVQGDLKMTVCLRQFSSLPAYVPLVARRVRKKQNRFLKGLRDDPHPLTITVEGSVALNYPAAGLVDQLLTARMTCPYATSFGRRFHTRLESGGGRAEEIVTKLPADPRSAGGEDQKVYFAVSYELCRGSCQDLRKLDNQTQAQLIQSRASLNQLLRYSSSRKDPDAKYPVDKETAVARSVVTKNKQQLSEQLLNNLLKNIQPLQAINAQDGKNQWLRLSRASCLNSREQDLYYSGK